MTPKSGIGMTLNYFSGVWYLIYTDDSNSNNLVLNCMDDDTSTWYGNITLKVDKNNGHTSTLQSSQAPSLAITNGGGFLVFTGTTHDEISWAYF
jgi:hypothetical protein